MCFQLQLATEGKFNSSVYQKCSSQQSLSSDSQVQSAVCTQYIIIKTIINETHHSAIIILQGLARQHII